MSKPVAEQRRQTTGPHLLPGLFVWAALLGAGTCAAEQSMPTVTINDSTYTLELADSAAAKRLLEMLPLELNLTELNGNEKYGALPQSLPVERFKPGTIHAGDVLLWQDDTLVIFYETFGSGYSYTALGKISDPNRLKAQIAPLGKVKISIRP